MVMSLTVECGRWVDDLILAGVSGLVPLSFGFLGGIIIESRHSEKQ